MYKRWVGPEEWKHLVRRIITNRPLVFFTGYDMTTLRDGSTPSSKDWRKVGTDDEGDITLEGARQTITAHLLRIYDLR